MNAYELAEKLEYDYWHAKANITMFKSADMLRQQADRIAELEHMNNNWQLSETMAYNRIAELEKDLEGCEYFLDKQQSAEPVAWTKKDTLIFLGNYEFGSITIQVQKQKDDEFDIPLYTTPQIKELSDEEIEKLQAEHTEKGHFADTLNVKDFARAILKKASEK